MTFSGRIRLFLILVALLPPLALIWSIYSFSNNESSQGIRREASSGLTRLNEYINTFKEDIVQRGQILAKSDEYKTVLRRIQRGQTLSTNPPKEKFDFAELVSVSGKILASADRPGMVGQTVALSNENSTFPTIEYDLEGRHAALTTTIKLSEDLILYCGNYLDNNFSEIAAIVSGAGIKIELEKSALPTDQMEAGRLFQFGDSLYAIADGNNQSYYLIAAFPTNLPIDKYSSLLKLTAFLTALSVLLAILIGLYLTGKSKREIENLRQAAARIAGGDLDTPVMAYSEGEFSELADAMTDMTIKLKAVRRQLSATEKIAAWETMGRRIAHEIKNPLTPLSISADDLRRSYVEKLPDFDKILIQTTSTIKSEVKRLTELLDQFVSFARMRPPELRKIKISTVINKIENVYKQNIVEKQLIINNQAEDTLLRIDSDQIEQVLLNIVKNGLEAVDRPETILSTEFTAGELIIRIDDNGPGFSKEQIENGFEPYVTSKEKGTGLGIIISQRIIYDHGGSIEFSNRESGGAHVLIRLPLHHG